MTASAAAAAVSGPCIAKITAPSLEVSKQIARVLVHSRLAACCNIVPGITSIYEWDGKVAEDAEVLLIVKTDLSKMAQLVASVRSNHPYDVPEVIAVPIAAGSPDYLAWMQAQLSKPPIDAEPKAAAGASVAAEGNKTD